MKYLGLVAVGLVIAGCVEADTPDKFKSERVAYAQFKIYRTIDTENNVACYTTYDTISCVKL